MKRLKTAVHLSFGIPTPESMMLNKVEPGRTGSFGRYEVTRDEVIEFASRYDPQPFHLDDAAAAATHFGRLAASGGPT